MGLFTSSEGGWAHRRRPTSATQQLNAVAPGVLGVEPPDIRQCVIPDHLLAGCLHTLGEGVELAWGYKQRRMGLVSRLKPILHTHVQLLSTTAKPHPAALA